MSNANYAEQTNHVADKAAQTADSAIKSTQRATNDAFDSLASTVHTLRQQAAPLLNSATEHASAILKQGMGVVNDSSQKVRAEARRASARTVNYVKDEPVKAILIAAVVGAALAALAHLAGRSSDDV